MKNEAEKNETKCSIEGHLKFYNSCNNVWTAVIQNANIKTDSNEEYKLEALKIVTCDAKVLENIGSRIIN